MKAAIKEWVNKKLGVVYDPSNDEFVTIISDCMADIGPKWISVEVMTPADDMRVLALIEGVAQITVARHGIKLNALGQWASHWMPFPEPPTQ